MASPSSKASGNVTAKAAISWTSIGLRTSQG
jgi:hypothetical protein